MEPDIRIEQEDPRRADVARLIEALDAYHVGLYPPEANHLLDIDALCAPDIVFLVARRGGEAVAIGALWNRAGAPYGEVKRMYVRPDCRGLGIGARMLAEIEERARTLKVDALMLETGTQNEAAIKLYERAGFQRTAAFGEYPDHPLSVFMVKHLISGPLLTTARTPI